MRYRVEIKGIRPILMHSVIGGLDNSSAANIEKAGIVKKRGTNRTEADELRLRELECQKSLWLNSKGTPTVPATAIRGCIEAAARKTKQGPQVREGMIVDEIEEFIFDQERYGTSMEEWSTSTQFTVPVVVQKARLMRTRAKFDDWGVKFILDTDSELVDKSQLAGWLDIAGRRVGLGDWRPTCSGDYGRFETVSIEEIGD